MNHSPCSSYLHPPCFLHDTSHLLNCVTFAGIKGTFALHLLIRATFAGIKGTFTLHLLIRATIAGIKGIYTAKLLIPGNSA
jgi:hypothetical protein